MTATESLPKSWLKESNSVYRASQDPFVLDEVDLSFLIRAAELSDLGRARVCAHFKNDESVHEMIIALTSNSYIRPHRHLRKSESYHLISGEMDVVLFDDLGNVRGCIPMTSSSSRANHRFLRFSGPLFHTMILHTPTVVFHEVTGGPIDPARTIYASWSPEESARLLSQEYVENLKLRIRDFQSRGGS